MLNISKVCLLSSSIVLAGCSTIGPNYEAPTPPGDTQNFVNSEAYSDDQPLANWWTAFDDEVLTGFIEDGVAENRTLISAAENVRVARANLGLTRKNRLPFDTTTLSYRESRAPSAIFAGTGIGGDGPREPNDNVDFSDLTIGANYEVDLFGRVTRLIEAARGEAEAQQALFNDLLVTVAADIADAYVTLRGIEAQRAVAQENVENQERTVGLTRALRNAGRVTDLDVEQARAQLATTKARIPPLTAAAAAARYRLGVLTGRTPEEITAALAPKADLPMVRESLPIGDAGQLIRRRPDIKASERRLAAATAGIGLNIATAFPRIDLAGNVGYRSVGFDTFFAPNALNFGFGPQISWSLTNLLRARDTVAGARAATRAAFADYEQTVLQALAEVETSLANQSALQQQIVELDKATKSTRKAAELARIRYEAGAVDFLNVLDTERRQLEAADALAAAQTAVARAQVAVFRALRAGALGDRQRPSKEEAEAL